MAELPFFDQLLFFEKPGCINNRKQKNLLAEAGINLVVRDLLTAGWRRDELRPFFGDLPVSQWFNRSAPAVKSGEVNPDALDEDSALAAMVADPLLIRRPLMAGGGELFCGFDLDAVLAALGKSPVPLLTVPADIESCPRSHAASPCGAVADETVA